MSKKQIPDFIKFNSEGTAEVTLSRPFDISGAKVSVIAMREPTVGDQLAAEKLGTGGEADVQYMANLCQIAPDDVRRLPLRDFKRLQQAFGFFID